MSLTDYSGVDAPFGIRELGSTFMTELAREIQQIQETDPLRDILPNKEQFVKEVRVEWTEEELRLMGVVAPGKPNKMNTQGKVKVMTHQAANFRRGDFIDQDLINHLRAPGGDAEKQYGMDMVQERLQSLVDQANLMFAYLRMQAMSGGIDYTDPETGFSVEADSGIPTRNNYEIGVNGDVVDLSASAKWHDLTNADVVADFQTMLYAMKLEGKNAVTHCVMGTAMRELISRGTKIRQFLPGNLSGLYNTGLVQWGEDGKVSKICGITIIEHYMLVDLGDPRVGLVREFMWPVEMVCFFSKSHPNLPTQTLGYTAITKGENPANVPGMYVRTRGAAELHDPQLPPGVMMQVGTAGLPVLRKPWWVHLVKASTKTAIKNALGDKYITGA